MRLQPIQFRAKRSSTTTAATTTNVNCRLAHEKIFLENATVAVCVLPEDIFSANKECINAKIKSGVYSICKSECNKGNMM